MFPPQTKILIVDDMKTMRVLLRKRLADMGLTNVTEAGDGEAAWIEVEKALSAQAPFQLILSDWAMPKAKGIHLLKRVRSNSQMKGVPFIMLTAENETSSVQEAVEAGVTGYLVKPFTTETLTEKLEAASRASAKKVA
jgi:two-component system chemotaxis response regulator CheY